MPVQTSGGGILGTQSRSVPTWKSISLTMAAGHVRVKARQEQLEADVVRSWERDALTKGTPQVHEKKNGVEPKRSS